MFRIEVNKRKISRRNSEEHDGMHIIIILYARFYNSKKTKFHVVDSRSNSLATACVASRRRRIGHSAAAAAAPVQYCGFRA